MKKRIYQALWLLPFAGFLASCDPEEKVTYYFENRSGGNIYIDRGLGVDTVKSSEVKVLASYMRIGGDMEAGDAHSSTKVYNDTDTCKKAIGVNSNWVKTNPKKYTYEYRFEVQDSDF